MRKTWNVRRRRRDEDDDQPFVPDDMDLFINDAGYVLSITMVASNFLVLIRLRLRTHY